MIQFSAISPSPNLWCTFAMFVPCLYMQCWLKVTIPTRILARHLYINVISHWLCCRKFTLGAAAVIFPSCLFHRLMALYFLPRCCKEGGWNSLAVHCSRDGRTSFCSRYVIFMRIYRLDSQWEKSLSASPTLILYRSLWPCFILAGSVALRKASESGDDWQRECLCSSLRSMCTLL